MSLRWVSGLLWFIFFSSLSHFLFALHYSSVWVVLHVEFHWFSTSFSCWLLILLIVLMVWLEINGTLLLIYFITLAWDFLTCISPWISPEMRLDTLMFIFALFFFYHSLCFLLGFGSFSAIYVPLLLVPVKNWESWLVRLLTGWIVCWVWKSKSRIWEFRGSLFHL